MIFPDKAAFLSSESIRSSVSEIQNVLAAIGFTDEQIANVQLGTGGTPLTLREMRQRTPVPDEGEDVGADVVERWYNKPRLSVGEGMRAFQAGNFSARGEAFAHFLAGYDSPLGTQKGNNIIDLIASAGNNESARDYLSQFFDIVAARGYHGMVNRPTTILAGDRGPERVDITPGGAGFMGGASGSRGTVVHFNVNVQALDPRGVRELMEGEVGDMLIERIRASSERGETVIYSTGVTTPPSV
jgi:hypothetical protein